MTPRRRWCQSRTFSPSPTAVGRAARRPIKLALEHLQQHHPASRWNIYLFHFSDGDNLPHDNAVCKTLVQDLLGQCNMVGYGEIRYQDDASFYGWMGQTPSMISPCSIP